MHPTPQEAITNGIKLGIGPPTYPHDRVGGVVDEHRARAARAGRAARGGRGLRGGAGAGGAALQLQRLQRELLQLFVQLQGRGYRGVHWVRVSALGAGASARGACVDNTEVTVGHAAK